MLSRPYFLVEEVLFEPFLDDDLRLSPRSLFLDAYEMASSLSLSPASSSSLPDLPDLLVLLVLARRLLGTMREDLVDSESSLCSETSLASSSSSSSLWARDRSRMSLSPPEVKRKKVDKWLARAESKRVINGNFPTTSI